MELHFIQARTLPALQELLQELMLRLVFIPQFHNPIYDGRQWVITWYSPIDKENLVERVLNESTT